MIVIRNEVDDQAFVKVISHYCSGPIKSFEDPLYLIAEGSNLPFEKKVFGKYTS